MNSPLRLLLSLLLPVSAAFAHDGAPPLAKGEGLSVLVYSNTAYYRHPDIPAINRWLVVMARPVANAAGETRGVVLVGIQLDRFQDALRVRNLPDGGVIQIVN